MEGGVQRRRQRPHSEQHLRSSFGFVFSIYLWLGASCLLFLFRFRLCCSCCPSASLPCCFFAIAFCACVKRAKYLRCFLRMLPPLAFVIFPCIIASSNWGFLACLFRSFYFRYFFRSPSSHCCFGQHPPGSGKHHRKVIENLMRCTNAQTTTPRKRRSTTTIIFEQQRSYLFLQYFKWLRRRRRRRCLPFLFFFIRISVCAWILVEANLKMLR